MSEGIGVVVKRSECFSGLYELGDDIELVVCIGGRGGMKTYEVSKFCAYSIAICDKRVQVLRDEKEGIKESIMNEVLLRYDSANRDGVFNRKFQRLDNGIKAMKTGEMSLFSKGFRASTLDKKANMKAVSNVDISVIEEGEDIRDEGKFNTYTDSIRKKGSFVVFIMNTPDIHHFIIRRYFNVFPVTVEDEPTFTADELDGYFKIVPKSIPGFVCFQSSFRDNSHLPEKTVRKYNWYGERDEATGMVNDLHHYMTSIQGYSTTGLKGQIFRNYKVISLAEYNALDYYEVYGVDFGTASPAGVIAVKVRNNNVYVRQLNYEPLSVIPLGKKLDSLGIKSRDLIIADCAEPDSIRELRFGFKKYFNSEERERYPEATKGFRNCLASPDKSIRAGIDKLLSMNIYVTEDSIDLLKELTMYVWAVDRDGKCMDKPIDDWNHLIDPLRYVIRGARVWGRVE